MIPFLYNFIQISGVNINSNGYSWLTAIITNKRVTFIPIGIQTDYAECKVLLRSEFKNKRDLDIADALISLGFGTAVPPSAQLISEDRQLERYFKQLSSVERKARRQRVGLWLTTLPPPSWPIRIFNKMFDIAVLSMTPPGRKLPQLLR